MAVMKHLTDAWRLSENLLQSCWFLKKPPNTNRLFRGHSRVAQWLDRWALAKDALD